MKECTKCNKEKPDSSFPLDYRKPGRTESRCKQCKAEKLKEWRANNRARLRSADRKRYAESPRKWERHLKDKYGISAGEYAGLLQAQDGVCAICREYREGRLCVDHCHASGEVRGLLCGDCNRMLGQARDNPETLIRGAIYLNAESATAFVQAVMEVA